MFETVFRLYWPVVSTQLVGIISMSRAIVPNICTSIVFDLPKKKKKKEDEQNRNFHVSFSRLC